MGTQRDSAYYDKIYFSSEGYDQHHSKSRYFPLWKKVWAELIKIDKPKVLEIGCGPGQFADMLYTNQFPGHYIGIDFSRTAISKANKVVPSFKFTCSDVLKIENYSQFLKGYNTVIALEVFEHTDNYKIINTCHPGTNIILTVPDFNDRAHIRHFKTIEEVRQRYQAKIEIKTLEKVSRWYILSGTVK